MRRWILVLLTALLVLVQAGCIRYVNEASDVTMQEVGPQALLKKYEYFKDVAAQLDKKQADIQVYEGQLKSLDETYHGVERTKWARQDLEQYNQRQSELAGIKASYNDLAAKYNADMAKFNWRFANVGGLPKGADQPLPREYAPYIER